MALKLSRKEKLSLLEMKERQLAKICREIYELSVDGRKFNYVMHPYVLVRVLDKEHITGGGIILPDTVQNKPVYEGIVLATWKPYIERRFVKHKSPDGESGPVHFDEIEIVHKCSLEIGTRVAFPHYEGLSLNGYLDDKYYRMIREGTDQNKGPFCSVLGTITYDGDSEVLSQIKKLTAKLGSVTTSGVAISKGADVK